MNLAPVREWITQAAAGVLDQVWNAGATLQ
jgi:hypothetical protein